MRAYPRSRPRDTTRRRRLAQRSVLNDLQVQDLLSKMPNLGRRGRAVPGPWGGRDQAEWKLYMCGCCEVDVVLVLFVGALTGVWSVRGRRCGCDSVLPSPNVAVRGCVCGGHTGTFPETSLVITCAFYIFSSFSNGVSMFDLLLLFQCYPEMGCGRFWPFSLSFSSIPRSFLSFLGGG